MVFIKRFWGFFAPLFYILTIKKNGNFNKYFINLWAV